MFNFINIFERIFKYYGFKTNAEFLKKFNVKQTTFSAWKNRNSIPYDILYLVSQQENLSLHWLLTGQGDMYVNQSANNQTISNSPNSIQAGNDINGEKDSISQYDATIFSLFKSSYIFAEEQKKLDKYKNYLALANIDILKER